MTDLESKLRREKWHLDGRAVRTLDDARAFLESVGFCMMYPMRNQAVGADIHGSLGWLGSAVA